MRLLDIKEAESHPASGPVGDARAAFEPFALPFDAQVQESVDREADSRTEITASGANHSDATYRVPVGERLNGFGRSGDGVARGSSPFGCQIFVRLDPEKWRRLFELKAAIAHVQGRTPSSVDLGRYRNGMSTCSLD